MEVMFIFMDEIDEIVDIIYQQPHLGLDWVMAITTGLVATHFGCGGIGLAAVDADIEINMPPGMIDRDLALYSLFKGRVLPGQLDLDIQEPVVHRPALNGPDLAAALVFSAAEPGHA